MQSNPIYNNAENLDEDEFKVNNVISKLINVTSKNIIFSILAVVVIVSFVSYTMVLCKENELLKLHRQTSITQMENVDVKTQVEFAKSIYNVESKAASLVFLHKPDKIIEVDGYNNNSAININDIHRIEVERVVGGY